MKSCYSAMVFLSLLFSNIVVGQTITQVKGSLADDIKQAQKRLSAKEKQVSSASRKLAHQIYLAEQQVSALREKTTLNRRKLDDKTLALTELKDRLAQWQQQESYQTHLLLELADTLPSKADTQITPSADPQDPLHGYHLMRAHLKTLQQSLSPEWIAEKIIFPGGEVKMAQVVKVGPVEAFWSEALQQGGVLDEQHRVVYPFTEEQNTHMRALVNHSEGDFVFDPSLGKALEIKKQSESTWMHLQKGGVWVLPIMAFACFALCIGLFKAWQLWRLPRLFPMLVERVESIQRHARSRSQLQTLLKELAGAQKDLIQIMLSTDNTQHRDDKLLAYMLAYRHKLVAFMGAIAITAAISPLLGLLGTVSGMIETFNMMTLFGSGDPSVVSGGISKALITTELGLVVAIPALILHALLNRYINQQVSALNNTAISLSKMEGVSDD